MYIILVRLSRTCATEMEINLFECLIMTNTEPARWIMFNDFLSFSLVEVEVHEGRVRAARFD